MSAMKSTIVASASGDTAEAPMPPGRRVRALAVLGAAAATLTVWAVAGPLAGVDLRVRLGSHSAQQVGPSTVAIVTILAGLAAWGLLAVLERFAPRARTVWVAIVLVALALSLAGPLTAGVTTAAKVGLAGMHLAAAAVLVPVLAGWAGSRRSQVRTASPV
jgi:hypothetical protein